MIRAERSRITCVVDSRLVPLVEAALSDLGVPEAFVQRAKQMSLSERRRPIGLGPASDLVESRSEIYRIHVPAEDEAAVARHIAEAADLYLPGRGSLFADDVAIESAEPAPLAAPKPAKAAGQAKRTSRCDMVCCIVRRGLGLTLARTVLEMGLCVPVISFGKGMGLRNKLGLLRITIPVEKEALYFVVPERDADFLESLLVHKARLDRPGQGFIYRYPVRAYAVNLSVKRGSRSHAASMEQVIAALDELRGSSEWRRLGPSKPRAQSAGDDQGLACVSLVAEEGSVGDYVKAAMDAGAGGATLLPLSRRSYGEGAKNDRASNARETCDLIVPGDVAEPVLAAVRSAGLLSEGSGGRAELSAVRRAVTYRG